MPPALAPPLRARRGFWAALAGAGAALAGLAALPPFVPPGARRALMGLFSLACHQHPARSFAAHGVPFALCHRCYGVAVGLALGALAAPLVGRAAGGGAGRRPLLTLAVAALPGAADWAFAAFGLWANTPASRLATGLAFGLAAGVVLGRAALWPRVRAARAAPPS